jgi:hypothetical protein
MAPAAASAAGLIGAYEHYVTGKGFEIGLVNVSTGQALPVPAAVNTTDDEVHPALSPDGRFLIFNRTRLVPKLNGDIVPPADRSLVILDRNSGAVAVQGAAPNAAGASFRRSSLGPSFTWGETPRDCCAPNGVPFSFAISLAQVSESTTQMAGRTTLSVPSTEPAPTGQKLETTAGIAGTTAISQTSTGDNVFGRYASYAYIDQSTGALARGLVQLSASRTDVPAVTVGTPDGPAAHPATRAADNYVALDLSSTGNVDIQTIAYPTETQLTPAPAAINTSAPERMPAWSPDSLQLGFVRSAAGRRSLTVFDATPGIQGVVLTPVDLGPEPPTPQTAAYQGVWGGISLANAGPNDVPAVACTSNCLTALRTTTLSRTILRPRVTVAGSIGIFVARVTGKRKLLGRTVPRIRVVGRVPLGATRKGTNTFRWNGKVEGRRLKRGTYLLTYRALRGNRVLNTSGSIRFKVARGGRITKVRRQR